MDTQFTDLPLEIQTWVFQHLAVSEVGPLFCVCKTWQQILRDSGLWREFFFRDFGSSVLFPNPDQFNDHTNWQLVYREQPVLKWVRDSCDPLIPEAHTLSDYIKLSNHRLTAEYSFVGSGPKLTLRTNAIGSLPALAVRVDALPSPTHVSSKRNHVSIGLTRWTDRTCPTITRKDLQEGSVVVFRFDSLHKLCTVFIRGDQMLSCTMLLDGFNDLHLYATMGTTGTRISIVPVTMNDLERVFTVDEYP